VFFSYILGNILVRAQHSNWLAFLVSDSQTSTSYPNHRSIFMRVSYGLIERYFRPKLNASYLLYTCKSFIKGERVINT